MGKLAVEIVDFMVMEFVTVMMPVVMQMLLPVEEVILVPQQMPHMEDMVEMELLEELVKVIYKLKLMPQMHQLLGKLMVQHLDLILVLVMQVEEVEVEMVEIGENRETIVVH